MKEIEELRTAAKELTEEVDRVVVSILKEDGEPRWADLLSASTKVKNILGNSHEAELDNQRSQGSTPEHQS